jgi:hypothetical protein
MIINEKCIKLNSSITTSISPYRNWKDYLEKFKNKNFTSEFDIACDTIKYNWDLLHANEEEHIINLSKKINAYYENR